MVVYEWLRLITDQLMDAGIESAGLEAQILAGHALGQDRSWVLTHPDTPVNTLLVEPLLKRRLRREPLAYIVGYREFFGRRFVVCAGVLIPRQETETLVETALEEIELGSTARVLDIGTGSGCIAVTLNLERKKTRMWGTDVSVEALEVASENADRLGADVRMVVADLFPAFTGYFDLIVSNPPYIADHESLMPEVGLFEPRLSLYAGRTGIEFYRRLAQEASVHLRPEGKLILELGAGQAATVRALFELEENGKWVVERTVRDLAGHERVFVARLAWGRYP